MKSKLHTPDTEQEWLGLRKKYITATEVGSILGVNKFRSANKMWQEKTGEGKAFTGNAYTLIGQLLEPVVVALTNIALEEDFKLYEGRNFFTNDELRLGATPDAHNGECILECKTTKPANVLRYSGSPPEHYIVQLMTQLMLEPERKHGYITLMSTNLSQNSPELKLPLVIFKVERNETLMKIIKDEAKRFFETVEAGKKFRSDSSVKRKVRILCRLCTTRRY